MTKTVGDNPMAGRVKEPPKKLTEDEIKNHTPERVRSSDLDAVDIRPAVKTVKLRDGTTREEIIYAEDGTPGFFLEIRKTNKKYAKALYSNKELLAMIKTSPQSDVLTEVSFFGVKWLQSEPLSGKIKAKVMLKVNEILKSRGGSLVDTNTEEINTNTLSARDGIISSRKGSSDLLNALVGWVDTEVFPALESAFNFLARGGGSFLDWVGTLSQKFRNVAAKAWKKAQEILKIPSLNRRGGIITLSQAIKAAKEQIAKAPQPQIDEPAISKPAAKSVVTEAAKESFKAGITEGKVRSDKRAARLKESATERYSKLQDKLNRLKKINQMNRLVRTQGKKFLIDLANRLPVAERASLIRAIANADTVLAQADVINRIDKL
ncbi:MAG TPA: hypothetical protein PLR50_10105, partial [Candidatus Rifleibacterium sp.]|nr:hypothetical protein [Candidatus Rifleibacterium sp.]